MKLVWMLLNVILLTSMFSAEVYLPYKNGYYSQCGQDEYLHNLLGNKIGGVFLDIGAHDGISYSNTYFFEKNLQWSGICFEPHPDRFLELTKNRSCLCINACVASQDGLVNYLKIDGGPEMLSGIFECYDRRHLERIDLELSVNGGTKQILKIPSVNINTILSEQKLDHIDLLCIDTEGSELEILKTINFKKTHIDLILIENNYLSKEIPSFLTKNRFMLIKDFGGDQLYKNRYGNNK